VRTRVATTVLLATLAATACSDTLDTSDVFDLTAVWQLSTTVTSNTCGLANDSTNTEPIILIQCGNEVSVITWGGLWGSGTVQGERLDLAYLRRWAAGLGVADLLEKALAPAERKDSA